MPTIMCFLQFCELCDGKEHQTKEGWAWVFSHPTCHEKRCYLNKKLIPFSRCHVVAQTEARQRILMAEKLHSGGERDMRIQELLKGYS